ncbi:MAG: hypothetical protein M1561_08285 [Gammaproteobacteria bacterium]|nr:hypothetical protein [Gammaproteobacteria bacterium]
MSDTDNNTDPRIPSPTQTGVLNDKDDYEPGTPDNEPEAYHTTELEAKSTSPHDEPLSYEHHKLENGVIWFLRILTWLVILASLAAVIAGGIADISIPKIIPAVGLLDPSQALAVFGAVTFTVIGFAYLYLEFFPNEFGIRWRGLKPWERIATAIVITLCVAAFLIAQIPLISEVVLPQDRLLWLTPVLTYPSVFLIVLTIGFHIGRMLYKGRQLDSESEINPTDPTVIKAQKDAEVVAQAVANAELEENNLHNIVNAKINVIVRNENHTASATASVPPLNGADQLPGTVNTGNADSIENENVYYATFRTPSSGSS